MISKIKDLLSKFKIKKSKNNDLKDSDFTKEIDINNEVPLAPNEALTQKVDREEIASDEQVSSDVEEFILDESKPGLKEKLFDLKIKFSDLLRRLKPQKKFVIPKNEKLNNKKADNPKKSFFNTTQSSNFKSLHKEILLAKNRNKIHKFFQISFVVLIVFVSGKLTALVLKGSPDYTKLVPKQLAQVNEQRKLEKEEVNEIKVANLFQTDTDNSIKPKIENKKEAPKQLVCDKSDKKSRLPVKLINTIVLQDPKKSIASIQIRSESLFREVRVGEEVQDVGTVGKIERLKLVFKNSRSGNCEYIESSSKDDSPSPIAVMSPRDSKKFAQKLKPIKGIKNLGNKFEIEKSFMSEKMKDISTIVTQARGVQINNPDGSISFKITDIVPGSVYSHLNIKDGDIITGIAGEKITDLNAVMSLFGKLPSLDQTSITIKRSGQEVTQEYKFK